MGSFLDWSMRLSWQAESKCWQHAHPFSYKWSGRGATVCAPGLFDKLPTDLDQTLEARLEFVKR